MVREGLARRLALQYAVKVLQDESDLQSYLEDEGITKSECKEAVREFRQIIRGLRERLAPEHRDV